MKGSGRHARYKAIIDGVLDQQGSLTIARHRAVAALPITAGCWARRPSMPPSRTRRDSPRGLIARRRLDRHDQAAPGAYRGPSARFCISSPAAYAPRWITSARRRSSTVGKREVHANNVAVREPLARRCDHPRITEFPVGGVRHKFRDRVPSARASPARSQRQIRDETGAALSCGAGLGVEAAQDTAGERNVDALDRIVEQSRAEGRHAEHPAAKVRIFA